VEFTFPFEHLEIWKRAKLFVVEVYKISSRFPKEERYGLTSQVRRAAVSVCSNISEGSARLSKKEQAYFIQTSYGSLMEAICQLDLAKELGFVASEELKMLRMDAGHLARMINAYHRNIADGQKGNLEVK
jgi:four helix bundle protein